MYKYIISDFGSVMVQVKNDLMTAPYVENEADLKLVGDVVFDRLYWNQLDDGSITEDEVKAAYRSRLPSRLWEAADKTLDNWYYHLPLIDGMKELYTELKSQGAKFYLLSNICINFAQHYNEIPQVGEFLSLFDGLVFSGPLHITKPSKEIFDYLLNTYGLKAEDCIFIDDSFINVAGAKNAGIEAYLFDGDVQKLREYLLK